MCINVHVGWEKKHTFARHSIETIHSRAVTGVVGHRCCCSIAVHGWITVVDVRSASDDIVTVEIDVCGSFESTSQTYMGINMH